MKWKHDERADDVQMLQAGVNNVFLTKETKMNEVILMAILSLLPLYYRRGKLHYNWCYSSLEDTNTIHTVDLYLAQWLANDSAKKS